TTYLKIPCLTLRDNTERPITTTLGTNKLIGTNYNKIYDEVIARLSDKKSVFSVPPLWDGKAGERIAQILCFNN
ncbi:UDP-N-acetyl glucosamine 2-epimerase, partial [Candidatus Bathyarchaeota archaeon]|nr:UDP-N-acetyl glucosamine 2-epimerase [Candidatus Bathyarchaeota archaeon]